MLIFLKVKFSFLSFVFYLHFLANDWIKGRNYACDEGILMFDKDLHI